MRVDEGHRQQERARRVAFAQKRQRAVADAQLQAFPENLLWDFDYYLASIHAEALESDDYEAHLRETTTITVELPAPLGEA